MDRDDFAFRQAAMTARWFEGVRATHSDVPAYIQTRQAAYLNRWREAGRFVISGSVVLDIGGGNPFPALVEYFAEKTFDYHYVDIDPAAVESSRSVAKVAGLNPDKFSVAFNDDLAAFADCKFDAVFSSHCIEHSIDVQRTLLELNRVLKNDGVLVIAVPIGWESNPEHPYFLGYEHWIALIQDSGFRIRVAQIGSEYPESGHDLFIAARKVAAAGTRRIDTSKFLKQSYEFVPHDSPRIVYEGSNSVPAFVDARKMQGHDWMIKIDVPASSEILPIFTLHDWSGIIEMTLGCDKVICDLYSWFTTIQPARCVISSSSQQAPMVTIRSVGRNPSSWATEAILHGVMFR
jgi:SAM-dependent methyltransferase